MRSDLTLHSLQHEDIARPRPAAARSHLWVLAACLASLAALTMPGVAHAAPGAKVAAGPDLSAEARTADRLVRGLRQHQQDGIWMPTALRSLDDFRNLHRDIEAQRPKAVTALLRAARPAQPDEAAARSALDALAQGEVTPAVMLLSAWEQAAISRGGSPREAAELARHQGALLAGAEVEQALAAYQRAARHDSGNMPTMLVINDLNSYLQASVPSAGLSQPALATSADALAIGRARIQAIVQEGQTLMQARNPVAALERFREALQAADQLARAGVPGAEADGAFLRDRSIVHNRVGDAQTQLGQANQALAAYRHALNLRERLASAPGAAVQAHRDLILSHQRVGDALARLGQSAEATRQSEQAVGAAQRLARQHPDLLDTQRDLAAAQERLAELQLQAGQLEPARTALREALSLRQRAAERDPGNRVTQREWANALDLDGDLARARKDLPAALRAVRQGQVLRQALHQAQPDELNAWRDLSISHNRLGDLQSLQGDRAAAVQSYREALRLRAAMVEREPDQAQWQRDLSVSHTKLADTQVLQGDLEGALAGLRAAVRLREGLVQRDASNTQWQGDLALALGKLSTVGSLPMQERQGHLERGQAIVEQLKSAGRLGGQQNWSAWFDAQKRLLDRPMLERATVTTTAQAGAAARSR